MILETIRVGVMQVNCYILALEDNSSGIIIDPGADEQKIRRVLDKHKIKPAFIINTHGHIDHIGCDDKFGIPVYIHSKDAELLRDPELNLSGFLAEPLSVKSQVRTLEDKEEINSGGFKLEVIHVPGHTPGGIALLMKEPETKILFSGDSLFFQSIGRSDFPGADGELLIKSIKEKLLILDDDTVIYPGHGASSTIGREKRRNPFLMSA
ncbi:MAG: MBL fold metallo-hydrolase [Candidatus Omnitrophica bacterium]|nr:MBL fold metallo-hydrolase [Candidatus Omnitrophota bacterium]